MSTEGSPLSVVFDPAAGCVGCGRFGAYGFSDELLCLECYTERGSCCGEDPDLAVDCRAGSSPLPADAAGTLSLNLNCCYTGCRGCSSVKKLWNFQARHPLDWRDRLRGSGRAILAAQSNH